MESYTGRDDAFFYSLVYDPHNKSLVADRGEIRIGSSYQVGQYITGNVSPFLPRNIQCVPNTHSYRWHISNGTKLFFLEGYILFDCHSFYTTFYIKYKKLCNNQEFMIKVSKHRCPDSSSSSHYFSLL